VVGVPSRKYGEEVCAFVIVKDRMEVPEEDIRNFVSNNLARHKAPKYVLFVSEFPTTASGKIQKYLLRQQAIESLNLADEANIETA
jgi:fatty-acyl-CoA synthase